MKTIRWQNIIAFGALVYGMAVTNAREQQVPSRPDTALTQSSQPATPANNATTIGEEVTIASNTSLTKLDQKKQPASVRTKQIAEKGKVWARELRPVPTTASSDAGQENSAVQPGDAAELAKKLSNPVSSLISFPIQTNFDMHMGTGSGWRMTTNVQPVIPVALNKEWNLISRTIIPFIHQANLTAPGAGQTGFLQAANIRRQHSVCPCQSLAQF